MCRKLFPRLPYASLEAPDTRTFATEDPRGFLARFPEGCIIDEVQRAPDILSYLQGIIDEDPTPGRWILTGSQNFSLLKSVSQSLAGRTAVYNLLPLARSETERFDRCPENLDETLFTGGYPRVFDRGLDPSEWFAWYFATYIERDARETGNIADIATFQRFVQLCAGRTAQLLNYSSLANDCGISQPTAKTWLGLLETCFIVFRLPAYHSNLRKRLVKMPKLHFYDTGLVCWLLGIRTPGQLRSHPLRGPLFETWAVSEAVKHRSNRGETMGLSFYRDRNGSEGDLIIERLSGLTLVDAKSSATPSSSLLDGIRKVRRHLSGMSLPIDVVIVYGGDKTQERTDSTILSWRNLHESGFWKPESAGPGPGTAAGVETEEGRP